MSQNFDEVTIDLSKPETVNVLSATDRMADADMTDSVESVEFLRVLDSSTISLEVNPKSKNPFEKSFDLVFQITNSGRQIGRLIFDTQIGSVELSDNTVKGDLVGVRAVFRITRVNLNRRPRTVARL